MLLEWIGLLASAALLIGLLLYEGRRSAAAEQMERELDDVNKANAARDRLRRDAGFAKRVRDRFTR